jgi:hypothetical protein
MKDYGKGIMAVLGVVLMLAFALPTVFTGQGDAGSVVRGTMGGKKVMNRDLIAAENDIQVLDYFRLGKLMTYQQSLDGRELLRISLDPRDAPTHWFLLLTEARRYGLSASEEEINSVIQGHQVDPGVPLTADELRRHLEKLGIPEITLREAIRHALMVHKLGQLGRDAVQVTVPELEALADGELSRATVDYAVLESDNGWEKGPEPTAEQVQKQFELYKDAVPLAQQDPGTAPVMIDRHTYPFGYKYPDRVQVEWLKFDAGEIRGMFKPTREDYEQAYAYYKAHPSEFAKSAASQPATAPGAGTQAATQTAGAGTQPGVESFEEAKERLVNDQIRERAQKLMGRMVDRALGMAGEPWKTGDTDAQGFHAPVAAEKWTSYEAVANEVAKNRDFNGYKPAVGHSTGWAGRAELQHLAGIGDAVYQTQQQIFGFPELALKVKELQPDIAAAKRSITTRLGLQAGVEGPVLQDKDGNVYVYRVTAAEAAHAPKSLDEVRGRVVDDLKRLATYEQRQAEAKALAAKAAERPAADLLTLAQDQHWVARRSEAFSRAGREDHLLAEVPGMIDAVFALAEKGASTRPAATQGAGTQSAATQGAATQAGGTATTTVADDARLSVYVVALEHYTPTTPALFAMQRIYLWMDAAFQQQAGFLAEWSGLDAVARRLNYVPTVPFAARKEES